MDFHSNLEFLCRVCAANTKGKNTVAECVYIMKTPGMRDKLEKFLFLKVFENDALPKVLCKSCFRQIEATASLSKIAKHTQQVFREFLFSSLPKGTTTTMDANSSSSSAEYTSSDFLSKKDTEKSQKANEITAVASLPMSAATGAQLKATPPPAPPPPPPPLQTITSGAGNTTPRKDEVVVNVSVSDPLTRENQQKVISNSQRRHSIMIEAASLASFANLSSTLAQLSQKAASGGGGRKSSSPSRVLKYCPIAPKPLQSQQASQQPNQVTTFSSGGYVIESSKPSTCPAKTTVVTTATETPEPTKKLPTLNAQMTSTVLPTENDNSILQQKRKNLVKALNNIKANSTGQVSLLKSSQQKQQSLLQQNQPQPAAKSLLLEQNKKTIEDELPDHIIIAAPKNKQTMSKAKKTDDSNANPKNSGAPAGSKNVVITEAPTPPTQANATPLTTAKTSNFPEDILLGRVIRDPDLLKLILKALKWPVNKQNMDLQLQRLRNTRFTDIMSDTNLLQDTDLTQLLGPYLAPVLMAAQALQQQQQQPKLVLKNPPAATASKKPSTPMNKTLVSTFVSSKPGLVDPTVEEINKAIPYKLPPETSVQLVPALPEEIVASQKETAPTSFSSTNTSLKRTLSKEALKTSTPSSAPGTKRQRKSNIQKHRDSIVISDEDEAELKDEKAPKANSSRQRSNKSTNNFEIDLSNPSFLAQLGLINGSSELANEALLALLQKQKMVLNKQQQPNTNPHYPPPPSQRRRHNSVSTFGGSAQAGSANEFDALINIDDDIVLMEPVTTTQPTTTTTSQPTSIKPSPVIDLHNFVMPAQVPNSAPLITRPIIKRRKTVIHSSSQVVGKEAVITSALAATKVAEPTNKPETAENNGPMATNEQNVDTTKGSSNLSSPTKTTAHDVVQTSVSLPSSNETSPSKQGCRNKQNKAALGQQLLEAIGLQKINPKAPALSLHYIPSSTTSQDTATTTANSNAKQSVQQIRSALKKSLKQAQEQQQQQMRSKEISSSTTVIQDADSTTKPAVSASPAIKEIVIEHKSNQVTDDGSSSHIDVEEQIDKTTVLKSQKAPTTTTTTTTIANTVENKPSKAEAVTKEQSLAAVATVLKKKLAAGRITERRCTLPSSMGRGRFSLNSKVEKEKSLSKLAEETKAATVAAAAKKETEEKIKSETTEADRINISSSSIISTDKAQAKEEETATPIPRRRGRKRATETVDRSETPTVNSDKDKEKENEKEKDKDKEKDKSKYSDKTKDELDETSSNSGRPTRQSKTLSKYYKGPEKVETGRRSLPARSTRNRKYC